MDSDTRSPSRTPITNFWLSYISQRPLDLQTSDGLDLVLTQGTGKPYINVIGRPTIHKSVWHDPALPAVAQSWQNCCRSGCVPSDQVHAPTVPRRTCKKDAPTAIAVIPTCAGKKGYWRTPATARLTHRAAVRRVTSTVHTGHAPAALR